MNDKLPPSLIRFAAELEQAIRDELRPRRDRRLGRVLRARPRLLAGTTVGAASIGVGLALVLSAAGSSPAFAVTRHRDGSYTVALRTLTAIPAANRKLSRLGARAWITKVGPGCNIASLRSGLTTARFTGASRSATTVIAAWRNGNQVKVASSMTKATASACVPPCPSGANWVRVVVTPSIHPGPSGGSSGNSGNSGSGSGNSGNSGSSGNGGSPGSSGNGRSWTITAPTTIACPGPPPASGGNSGNSGNSGSGNS
jgi:hypothetical protein